MNKHLLPLAALTGFALTATPAPGALLVYEGFQYGTAAPTRTGADLLNGQPDDPGGTDTDATGLGGAWADTTSVVASSDMFLASGSLSFGDLATTGNHVRSDTNSNNDLFTRGVTANLATGTELWFSILANKLLNSFSAAEGGFVVGNQTVGNNRIYLNDGTDGLQGFGVAPTTAGNNWTAFAWDGSSQTAGDASYTVATDGSETNLLVGRISLGTGTAGTDEYTLYYYDLAASGGSVTADLSNLVAIGSTIEIDVDEATLDTLSMTRQVNVAYDEIRITDNFAEVLGIPEPSSVALLGLGVLGLLGRRRR